MATGTKIRLLARLLDASDAPLWAIAPDGRLAYLSAGCSSWLGIDAELLIDRRSVAGSPVSDEPLDRLAACLSPPQGLRARGTASLRIHPPSVDEYRPTPMEVRFVMAGEGDSALTLGVAGSFNDRVSDPEIQDAVAIRQRLDAWRKRDAAVATIATAGTSDAARRLRRRLQVAGNTRCDVGFFGPVGSANEAVAARVHQLSSPREPMVTVDGPLMDAELLDATLMPLVHQLSESSQAQATALVRGLDEMPSEAQHRLAALLDTFSGRLRLLALCGPRPNVLAEVTDEDQPDETIGFAEEEHSGGIQAKLLEVISALTVVTAPLASRVEDIPLIATAMLDARHAAREGTAERLSRAALDALVIYPWPKNIVELEEAIRNAVRRATGESIGVEHLPLAIRSYRPGAHPALGKQATISLDDAVQRYERRLIDEAIQSTDGNRAEAARRLGISRARLLRKIDDSATHLSDKEEP